MNSLIQKACLLCKKKTGFNIIGVSGRVTGRDEAVRPNQEAPAVEVSLVLG